MKVNPDTIMSKLRTRNETCCSLAGVRAALKWLLSLIFTTITTTFTNHRRRRRQHRQHRSKQPPPHDHHGSTPSSSSSPSSKTTTPSTTPTTTSTSLSTYSPTSAWNSLLFWRLTVLLLMALHFVVQTDYSREMVAAAAAATMSSSSQSVLFSSFTLSLSARNGTSFHHRSRASSGVGSSSSLSSTSSSSSDNADNNNNNEDGAEDNIDNNKPKKPWTVFYNLYMSPDNPELQEHSKRIVEEQIMQVGISFAVKYPLDPFNQTITKREWRRQRATYAPTILYYNTIGKRADQAWFHALAERWGMIALHMEHYNTGFETVTLQEVQNYCHQHPDEAIIYLHNKGSFNKENAGYDQTLFRRLITFAATHPICLNSVMDARRDPSAVQHPSCQTCGLLFQPLPAFHYPGNMWAARCEYLRILSPPSTFEERMDQLKETYFQRIRKEKWLRNRFFGMSPAVMGLARYASEHWLGSHPHLTESCHVSPLPRFTALTFNEKRWQPDWPVELVRGGPGFTLQNLTWQFYLYNRCANCTYLFSLEQMRRTEYSFLGGFLFKWKKLYHAFPPANSWVWDWFPDGDFWQQSLNSHPLLVADMYQDEPLKSLSQGSNGDGGGRGSVPNPSDTMQVSLRQEAKYSITRKELLAKLEGTLGEGTANVVKSRNTHDVMLYSWALTKFGATNTNEQKVQQQEDDENAASCLVLFQLPRTDILNFARFLRRVAARKGWEYFRMGDKLESDLWDRDFAQNTLTSGLLTPGFFHFAPNAEDCLRMVILREPVERAVSIFESRHHPPSKFLPCFTAEVFPSPQCEEAHNYQDDMVRQLGSDTKALTVWNQGEYLRKPHVDVLTFDRAKVFLSDMDLVCFFDRPDDCFAGVRKIMGFAPSDIQMPPQKRHNVPLQETP